MYGLLGSFLAHFCVARMHARSHSVRFGRFCKCDGNAGSKRKRVNMSKVSGVGEAANPHAGMGLMGYYLAKMLWKVVA